MSPTMRRRKAPRHRTRPARLVTAEQPDNAATQAGGVMTPGVQRRYRPLAFFTHGLTPEGRPTPLPDTVEEPPNRCLRPSPPRGRPPRRRSQVAIHRPARPESSSARTRSTSARMDTLSARAEIEASTREQRIIAGERRITVRERRITVGERRREGARRRFWGAERRFGRPICRRRAQALERESMSGGSAWPPGRRVARILLLFHADAVMPHANGRPNLL